jgi:16S rRNA (cytidine1402-2'-O)-methyltransferase
MRTFVYARHSSPSRSGPDAACDTERAGRRGYLLNGHAAIAPALVPGLYIVSTPIGNLRDITLRALEVLAAADIIACEDTRVTRKLLDHYGIGTPVTPYHEHNATAARPKLIARLVEGASIALVSDAGTPLVSDPGFKLVRAAQDAGIAVTTAPGPSAALAALTVAGLPTDRFFFEGFLPSKAAQRAARIAALRSVPATLLLYETGPRIGASLADLAAGLGPREAALCRELTKLHEELRRGDLASLASHYAGNAEVRGEFVIVVAPPPSPDRGRTEGAELDDLLRNALDRLSVKEAVAEVASVIGRSRREVYQRALALAKERAR